MLRQTIFTGIIRNGFIRSINSQRSIEQNSREGSLNIFCGCTGEEKEIEQRSRC